MRAVRMDEWSDAMTLAARCFVGEPFMVHMFGVEPLRRFALAQRFYQSSPWRADDECLGAFVGDVLVGICVSSSAGQCQICQSTDPGRPPEDPVLLSEWQFEINTQAAHADQGTHAWLRRVAVDPALQRAGIGRALIVAALSRLRAARARAVLLECQPHRQDFYAARGFRRVGAIREPSGPDAILMRTDLEPVPSTSASTY
jgi:GNAT superfamily N-acetyltransferase